MLYIKTELRPCSQEGCDRTVTVSAGAAKQKRLHLSIAPPVPLKRKRTRRLREALRKFRDEKPVQWKRKDELFMIFQDETMELLISERPTTLRALHEINGIGLVKLNGFGKELLKLIKAYPPKFAPNSNTSLSRFEHKKPLLEWP